MTIVTFLSGRRTVSISILKKFPVFGNAMQLQAKGISVAISWEIRKPTKAMENSTSLNYLGKNRSYPAHLPTYPSIASKSTWQGGRADRDAQMIINRPTGWTYELIWPKPLKYDALGHHWKHKLLCNKHVHFHVSIGPSTWSWRHLSTMLGLRPQKVRPALSTPYGQSWLARQVVKNCFTLLL